MAGREGGRKGGFDHFSFFSNSIQHLLFVLSSFSTALAAPRELVPVPQFGGRREGGKGGASWGGVELCACSTGY
ncbi:hypothetical protein HOY80DRAFT_982170 [Tuber brumale]|nr:hypothetical protein HOY80DRAFT_982170 [Tuber brumale]